MSTYTLIQSQTLASSAASVTFSAIPATYTDLVLRVSARSDDAAYTRALTVAVNGSTALTSYTNIYEYNNIVYSSNAGFNDFIQIANGLTANNATANTFNSAEIYFPNYNSTGQKPVSLIGAAENNSGSNNTWGITPVAGLFRTSSAITSITVGANSGNLMQYSSFSLYGISNS